MEDAQQSSEALYLDMEYWRQETDTWLELGDSSIDEIVRVIRDLLGREGAHYAHSVDQDTSEGVLESRGEDTGDDVDHVPQEPEEHFADQQDPVEARGQAPARPKRPRVPFKQWQVEKMEKVFQHTHYPQRITRERLARVLKEPESRVKIWFQNQRAKCRKTYRKAMLRIAAPDSLDDVLMDSDPEKL